MGGRERERKREGESKHLRKQAGQTRTAVMYMCERLFNTEGESLYSEMERERDTERC